MTVNVKNAKRMHGVNRTIGTHDAISYSKFFIYLYSCAVATNAR